MKRLFINLTKEQHAKFKELAKDKEMTMNDLFRLILKKYENEKRV